MAIADADGGMCAWRGGLGSHSPLTMLLDRLVLEYSYAYPLEASVYHVLLEEQSEKHGVLPHCITHR